VGISEVEFLGSGPSDDDDPQPEAGAASPADSDDAPDAHADEPSAAPPPPTPRTWRRPVTKLRQLNPRHLPGGRVTALLAALLIAVAAGAFVFVQQSRAADDAFDVTLVSASYALPQNASGINLSLAIRNTGAAMVELTSVTVDQPGLIRLEQNNLGTEVEASPAVKNAITPVAMTPQDVEVLNVPFRYDCTTHATPPVTHTISLGGVNARGAARTITLTLPADASPWDAGDFMRSAVCGQPSPRSQLSVRYGGIGSTLMELTPVRFDYTIVLAAPTATVVTVNSISQDNPGIAASVDPALPAQVLDGQTVELTVTWRVMSCVIANSVRTGDGVEITATANQITQTWHATLGAQFTRDLDAEITTVCSGG